MSIFLDQESFARFEKNRTSLMPNKCASFCYYHWSTMGRWEGGTCPVRNWERNLLIFEEKNV